MKKSKWFFSSVFAIAIVVILILSYFIFNNNDNNEKNNVIISNSWIPEDILLTISVSNEIALGEDIHITVLLKNIGNRTINISKPELIQASIDFVIITPNSTILYYIGPVIFFPPPIIALDPGEMDISVIIINVSSNHWGYINSSSEWEYYHFLIGYYNTYARKAYDYHKWLYSNVVEFYIV